MHENPLPWYRQFWPWFVMALPATAVVASIATLVIAAHDPDGLVVDDYYKEGLAINQTLERDRAARALGLAGLVRLDSVQKTLVLTMDNLPAAVTGEAFELRMIHPTRPHLDRTLHLEPTGNGEWSATLDDIAPGRWHLQLEANDGTWRLAGRLALPDQQQALLAANAD